MDEVAEPLLQSKLPGAVVDNTELPQLFTTFTDGVTGVGFTVMANVTGVPLHPFTSGVTVMFATWGMVPVLIAVKDEISPVPLAARPILILSFIQLYVVSLTPPVNATAVAGIPLQTTWFVGVSTAGIGFIFITVAFDVALQPAASVIVVV